MRLSTIAAGLIACLITDVAATSLTYRLDANERACFYAETKADNEKIAFYFAVRKPPVSFTIPRPHRSVTRHERLQCRS